MPYRYSTGDERLDEDLAAIVERFGPSLNADLIHQMMVTCCKLVKDGTERGDVKILNTTLKEMRYAFKVFSPYRRLRKVSLFGSARCGSETDDYQQAVAFAEEIARRGFMIITGAGHGIMEAGNRGAGRDMSFGVNIRLPFEQVANDFIAHDKKLVNFKYFFTRKLAFLKETHGIVCSPGGFGTHDEGLEVMTLVQTGKSHMLPIVFMHPEGGTFWTDWHNYVTDRLLTRGMISPEDLSLYKITDNYLDACDEVTRFYRRYHSMRYVRDFLIIRLEAPLNSDEVEQLNDEFADLLKSGRIETCEALKEETDADIRHLPRLKMHFRRRSFGRLRQMVDRINSFPLPYECVVEVPEAGEGGQIPDEIEDGEISG